MEKRIAYDVLEKIVVLRDSNGYTKELRLVSWNGGKPKLDLREWMPDGRCRKGITLSDEEGLLLLDGLRAYFEGR